MKDVGEEESIEYECGRVEGVRPRALFLFSTLLHRLALDETVVVVALT